MAMYRNINSVIRINSSVEDKFGVKVGIHQGSVRISRTDMQMVWWM